VKRSLEDLETFKQGWMSRFSFEFSQQICSWKQNPLERSAWAHLTKPHGSSFLEHQDLSQATWINLIMKKLSRASRQVRVNEELSSGLHPQERHQTTPSHPCSIRCDIENGGGSWCPLAAAQRPLNVADPWWTRRIEKVDGEVHNPFETIRTGCRNSNYESAWIGRPAKTAFRVWHRSCA
jgi:hypothetical protein